MALTPEDVVTKQFQLVRFKEGFDPDEVDDFLDAVVVEWRKTIKENEELKAKLAAYESGETPVAEQSSDIVDNVPAPVSAAATEEAESVVVEEAPPVPAAPEAPSAPVSATAEEPAAIIQLATQLHDDYVAKGKAKAEELIAEAESKLTEAESRAHTIVADAEAKGRDELARYESERQTIETRITELRQFERDYRSQLRGFIEEKLRDLDVTGTSSGATPIQN